MKTIDRRWGSSFKEARRRALLSQSQVAYKAGVSQSFVSRFEAGRDIRLSALDRLYLAVGVRASISAAPAPFNGVPRIPVSA